MRAFIAFDLPIEFEEETAALARQLSAFVDGRFMRQETYHVTAAFLGDIAEADTARAMEAMDAACEGIGEVPLIPDGLGKFGRAEDATLWMGLRQEEALMSLVTRVRENLKSQSLDFDSKPFMPHITLARRAHIPKGQMSELVFPFPTKTPALALYKSTLTNNGAEYKPLYSVELGKQPEE